MKASQFRVLSFLKSFIADSNVDNTTQFCYPIVMTDDQSFTSLDIKVSFIRPLWKAKLRAEAFPIYSGKSITHYKCEIKNEDDKLIAYAISTVMTLNGDKAKGR